MTGPAILALDFDGVICNGLREYFQTSKRTYQKLWLPNQIENLEIYASRFYQLRPVIETGWEMPLLIHAMVLGYDDMQILNHWANISSHLIEKESLNKMVLMATLDEVRDHWIQSDLEGWLSLHQFYDGVIEKLKKIMNSSTYLYIVTTKEGRFVKQLLKNQDVELPAHTIYGKEIKQPKYQTLQQILQFHAEIPEHLWFVEDLLKTLQSVQKQNTLQGIKLYLADWGYNTPKTRAFLEGQSTIKCLSLDQFCQDFPQWNDRINV